MIDEKYLGVLKKYRPDVVRIADEEKHFTIEFVGGKNYKLAYVAREDICRLLGLPFVNTEVVEYLREQVEEEERNNIVWVDNTAEILRLKERLEDYENNYIIIE